MNGTTQITSKKKQCRKLTREEKKAVWNTKTEENAGLGWSNSGRTPREFNQDDITSISPSYKRNP